MHALIGFEREVTRKQREKLSEKKEKEKKEGEEGEKKKRRRKKGRKIWSSVKNFDNHSGKLKEIVRSIVSKQRRKRNRQSVVWIAERDRLLVNRQRIGVCGQ